MRPLPEAQRTVLEAMPALPAIRVPLAEARGLVLAADIEAPHDVPPFDNSGMDGFALRSSDTVGAPTLLEVVGEVAAGSLPIVDVGPGTAVRIMTGAPIPAGADTVAEVEITEAPSPEAVVIREAVEAGRSIRPAGGDLRAGETVLVSGLRLGAHDLGVLATVGVVDVPVRRRPRVAVLSTGDEVLPPDADRVPAGAIRDANRPMLVAMLDDVGVETLDAGIVPDDAGALRAAFASAAEAADVVVSSGGVSMGERDLVKRILGDLGKVETWRVAMQPAKPFAFGRIGDVPVFGLPGNPVSVTVAFEQFVRPGLLRMMGASRLFRSRVAAVLAEGVSTNPDKVVFLRVAVRRRGDLLEASPSGVQESNVLSALARADAFAVIPVGTGDLPAGSTVELELFRSPEGRTAEEALR
jgi:molybdopterin molybdotransferase